MEFSKEELVKIIERSSTIGERLGTGFLLDNASDYDDIINSKLQKWCQVAAKGDQDKFQKRLEWDGLTLSTVRRALGSVRLTNNQNLPPWVETLKEGIKAAALISIETLEKGATEEYPCLDSHNPIPFEELFLPFINVARCKLITQVGDSYHCLSTKAQTNLVRGLLGAMAGLCSQTMEVKFSAFRASRQSSLFRLLAQSQNNHSRNQYNAFIKLMLKEGGLLSFFQEYPVLARLVATRIDFWVDATGEFLRRLASNRSEIQQIFQPGTELGQVVAIQPFLSDPHNQGRSVIAVAFASGLKLIYKPKDLGLEEAYVKLLNWCNQQKALLPFKLIKVLNYSTYGWVELVEYLPCQDIEEVKRYYQRTGQLLCLLYALGATDCHHENLIACGEYPVLVDMETLMCHRFREISDQGEGKGAEALSLARQQLNDSVAQTCLLPRWDIGSDGRTTYDFSGLGAVGEQQTSYRVPKWNNINTDGMSLELEPATLPLLANVPSLEKVSVSPNGYLNELVNGFQQMYRFLVAHREVLLASDSPLVLLAHQRVRCVFRNTHVYSSVLQKSLHSKFLRDGADRSIELDVLSRALLDSDSKNPLWPFLSAERQALEQMDVPYFAADSNSDALSISPSQTIEQCFKEPSYDRVISRLQQLSDQDLAQQITIIQASFYSRFVSAFGSPSPSKRAYLNLSDTLIDAVAPLGQEQIVQQAIAIAQDLKQRAIRAADSSATWIGLGYVPEAQRFQLQPLGYGLYDGSSGVALFLAALETVTGDNGFRNLTLEALQPLRKFLQNSNSKNQQKIARQTGIGGATGLGSVLYALVRISQLLREPVLLQDAKQAASLMTLEAINTDRNFDVTSGAAGAILGLLALYKATVDPAVLEQATTCGHHLLNNRVNNDAGPRAWLTLDGKLMTGFSHGAAGIAYALLRLYETTQNVSFLEAAIEAITYERSVFSPEAGNWPDLRGEKTSFMTSWCHGAPGIGLARLGGLSVLDTCEIRQEIEVALKTTQQVSLQDLDRLCCGNFGRMEVLLVAAHQLSRLELLETAQKQAAWVVSRAEQAGSFYLFPNLPRDIYIPGLFLGIAGIGYELLRLAYSGLLPSVLLWE